MTASFLTYPLDLLRTVMSVKVDGVGDAKPTVKGCVKEIIAKDGYLGLYKGLPSTMCVS